MAADRQPDFRQRVAGARSPTAPSWPKSPAESTLRRSRLRPTAAACWSAAPTAASCAFFRSTASRCGRPARFDLGFEPRGIAVSPDGTLAYVALTAANEVAVVDLDALEVQARIAVGRWPRYLALTPDGNATGRRRAAATAAFRSSTPQHAVEAVRHEVHGPQHRPPADLGRRQVRVLSLDGLCRPADHAGQHSRGLGAGQSRGPRRGSTARPGARRWPSTRAAAPWPIRTAWRWRPTSKWLAISASGTHELVVFRLADLAAARRRPGRSSASRRLPATTSDSSASHSAAGRWAFASIARASRVFVANYLDNSVQVVNLADAQRRAHDRAGRAADAVAGPPRRGDFLRRASQRRRLV